MCVHEKENVNKKFEKEREKELCKTEMVGDSPIWFENAFYYVSVPCKSFTMFQYLAKVLLCVSTLQKFYYVSVPCKSCLMFCPLM